MNTLACRRARCEAQIERCDELLRGSPNNVVFVQSRRFWARVAYMLSAQMEREDAE